MKINRHKLLHYVLIILLMFAPLRSVVAMQQTHCDMGNHIAGLNVDKNAENNTVISDATGNHDMMLMSMAASSSVQNSHDCCSGKSICTNNCDMSISVSMLMQDTLYAPNFTNSAGSVALTTDLIKREFIPPFRPPLAFHS